MSKATTSKVLLLLTLTVVVFSISVGTASADVVLAQQLTYSTSTNGVPYSIYYQDLGTGLPAVDFPTTLTVRLKTNTGTKDVSARIRCFTTSAYTTDCGNGDGSGNLLYYSSTSTINTSWSDYTFYFASSTYSISASRYYRIGLSVSPDGTGSNVLVAGSAANTYAGGDCILGSAQCAGGVADIYFKLQGSGINTGTAITSLNSPSDGQVTPSTAVTFSFTYFNYADDGYLTSGISLVDVTAGQSLVGATSSIIVSGTYTQNFTKFLTAGHQYKWSAYLQKQNGQRLTSLTRTFYAASTPSFSSSTASLVPIDQITDSNASSTIQNLLNNVNIFSLLADRVPFAYIFLIVDQIGNNLNWPATSDYAAVTLSIPLSTSTAQKAVFVPTSFVIFSTTTIRQYIPDVIFNSIYLLMQGAIWVSLMFVLWRRKERFFV